MILQLKQRSIERSIRPSDILIASYPKSGRSWLSFMISKILRKDLREEKTLWDFEQDMFYFNNPRIDQKTLSRLNQLSNPRFFQTHLTSAPSFSRVIYLLRDPRDVMVSYWHYKRLTEENFNLSLKEFVFSKSQWPCQWQEHVTRWLMDRDSGANILMIKYEELLEDAGGILRKVLDFAELKYEDKDISWVVGESTFDKMKSMEEEEWKLKGGGPEERFIRRGQAGGWKDELDLGSLEVIEQRCGDVMEKMRYPRHANYFVETNKTC